MIYTKLGKSDLNVSRICMGCMGIGDPSKGMNKVLLINGSPNEHGCTDVALREAAASLNKMCIL